MVLSAVQILLFSDLLEMETVLPETENSLLEIKTTFLKIKTALLEIETALPEIEILSYKKENNYQPNEELLGLILVLH